MRSSLSITFFIAAAYVFLVDLAGNHGNIMFRPWMKDDWIIWGIIAFFFILGVVLLTVEVIRLKQKKPRL